MYDTKCYELAEHFLGEAADATAKKILAQHIQNEIDQSYRPPMKLCGTRPVLKKQGSEAGRNARRPAPDAPHLPSFLLQVAAIFSASLLAGILILSFAPR